MSYKLTHYLFFFTTIACAGLRIYLKLTLIDPHDGFYLDTNPFLITFFNLLLIVACAAILFTAFREGKHARVVAVYSKRVNALALLAGIFALPTVVSLTLAQFDYMTSPLMNPFLLIVRMLTLGIAPAVGAVLLIWVGFRAKGDSDSFRIHGVLALLPLIWQLANLLSTYMSYTAIRSVSDQQLTVVMLIFLVPYLLAWGRVLGNVNPDKGIRQMTAFGLCYALLAVSISTGVIFAFFFGYTVDAAMSMPDAFFHLAFGLYTAALCCTTRQRTF